MVKNEVQAFKICPVIESVLLSNRVPESFFPQPISTYTQDRITSLITRYVKNTGKQHDQISLSFKTWDEITALAINDIMPQINRASWKRYKTALQRVFNAALEEDIAPSEFIRDLLTKVLTAKVKETETYDLKTPIRKAKRLLPAEIYTMRLSVKDEAEALAVRWLEFSLITNLRPNELVDAELNYISGYREKFIDGTMIDCPGVFIQAKNTIKSDATRQNIETGKQSAFRQISLNHISYHSLVMIESFLIEMKQIIKVDGFDVVYENYRKKLQQLSKRCFNRSIALSVGRKQYAANHKKLVNDNAELANEMGHSDPTRPERSYGRKGFGFAKLADKENVEEVKEE